MTPTDAQQQQAEQLVSDILGPRTRDCDGAYNEYVQLIAHALREAEQRGKQEILDLFKNVNNSCNDFRHCECVSGFWYEMIGQPWMEQKQADEQAQGKEGG